MVALDVAKAGRSPRDGHRRADEQTLDGVSLVGGRLIAAYLVDAKTEARVHGLDGKLLSARSRCPASARQLASAAELGRCRDLLQLRQLQPADDHLPL